MRQSEPPSSVNADLLSQPPDDCLDGNPPEGENPEQDENWGSLAQNRETQLQKHWQTAMEQAAQVARSVGQGKLPAGTEPQFRNYPKHNWTGVPTCGAI